MPIETTCQTCACRLRVADQHAGRPARCPQCGSVYRVPERSEAVSSADRETVYQPLSARPVWQLRTPDGRLYGPVSRPTLDQWVVEGRVPSDASVGRCDTGRWYSAVEQYPQLAPHAPFPDSVGGAAIPAGPLPVLARPSSPQPTVPPAYRRPHRGRLVLTLGLLGWLICPLFAAWACSMGWTDLRAMREGTMDPEGQSLTQAGLTLGLIEIAVFVSAFALFFAGVLR